MRPTNRPCRIRSGRFARLKATFLWEELRFVLAWIKVLMFQILALRSLVFDCEEQSLRPQDHWLSDWEACMSPRWRHDCWKIMKQRTVILQLSLSHFRVNNEFIVCSRSPNLNLEKRIRRSSNRFELNGHWGKNEKGNQRELSPFLNDLCKLIVSKLLLWDPKHGRRSRGRPATTFTDQLESGIGLSRLDLAPVMANRREWDRLIKSVRVHPK